MRTHLTVPLVFISSLLPGTGEDRLTLGNGDLFVGEVVALEEGLVRLQSPHGVKPLAIPSEDLVELNFGSIVDAADDGPLPRNSQELVLHNGDRFPGQLTALDDATVTFNTWFTGELQIPRREIESIYFGVTPQEMVYRGPNDLQEWELGSRRSWTFKDGTLQSSQQALIGKAINLPENFIFRATIGWQGNAKSKIYLCNEAAVVDPENPGDCYCVSFESNDLKIYRFSVNEDGDNISDQLVGINLEPTSGSANSTTLEIRIDRQSRMIYLYLDGNRIDRAIDPRRPPGGSALTFENENRVNSAMTVSDLTIQKWDTVTHKLRLEPSAGNEVDTLVVREGDRFSGKVTAYDPSRPNDSFSFKMDLSPEPLVIPRQHCAILYFAQGGDLPTSKGSFEINLRVGGQLTLSRIKLNPETLSATHPWLGELKIDRRAMKSITKSE